MKNKNSLVYAVLFMLVLSALTTLILAVLDQSTRQRVEVQQRLETNKAILYSAGIQVPDEQVEAVFGEKIKAAAENTYEYYEGGERRGVIIPWEGPLLWGVARGYLGISEDGRSLLGMDVVSNAETPGLGGRITEDWFRGQFRGMELKAQAPYLIYRPAAGGNVDAVTGATQTSESLRVLLNETLSGYLSGKGGN